MNAHPPGAIGTVNSRGVAGEPGKARATAFRLKFSTKATARKVWREGPAFISAILSPATRLPPSRLTGARFARADAAADDVSGKIGPTDPGGEEKR